MDYANLFSKILAQTVAFMQDLLKKYNLDMQEKSDTSNDKESIIHLLRVSEDFTAMLDAKKAANYKLAILVEFLENVASMLQMTEANNYDVLLRDIHDMFNYIDEMKASNRGQEEFVETCASRLESFYDFDAINPQVVTFWLNSICSLESLRKMQVFMLYLPKCLHEDIFKMNKNRRSDPNVQLLIKFLNE